MSEGLVEKLVDSIMKRLVKTNLAKVIRDLDIGVFELENNFDEISIPLEEELKTSLNEFGISLYFFSLERIRTSNNRVFLEQKKAYMKLTGLDYKEDTNIKTYCSFCGAKLGENDYCVYCSMVNKWWLLW